MQDLLFDTPWWLPSGLIALGVGLFIYFNNRRQFSQRNWSMMPAALGVLLIILSYAIDTPRETCEHGTRALAAAVPTKDWKTFRNLLADDAVVSLSGQPEPLYVGADQITTKVTIGQERQKV